MLKIHLKKRHRDPKNFDLERLAKLCDGFSGAEIEEAIISGLFDAFSQGSRLEQRDPARQPERDGTAVAHHERGDQPAADLGAGPDPSGNGPSDTGHARTD